MKKDEKFPPGGICYEKDDFEQENIWRETSFAFRLIKQSINPRLSIIDCMVNWKLIQKNLSENPRKRKGFREKMYTLS